MWRDGTTKRTHADAVQRAHSRARVRRRRLSRNAQPTPTSSISPIRTSIACRSRVAFADRGDAHGYRNAIRRFRRRRRRARASSRSVNDPGEHERENCLVAIDIATGTTHGSASRPRLLRGAARRHRTGVGSASSAGTTRTCRGTARSCTLPRWPTTVHSPTRPSSPAARPNRSCNRSGSRRIASCLHPTRTASGISTATTTAASTACTPMTPNTAARHGDSVRRYYCALGSHHVVAQRMHKGATSLLIIDVDNGMATPLASDWQAFFGLALDRGRLYFIGGSPDRLATITSIGSERCCW